MTIMVGNFFLFLLNRQLLKVRVSLLLYTIPRAFTNGSETHKTIGGFPPLTGVKVLGFPGPLPPVFRDPIE